MFDIEHRSKGMSKIICWRIYQQFHNRFLCTATSSSTRCPRYLITERVCHAKSDGPDDNFFLFLWRLAERYKLAPLLNLTLPCFRGTRVFFFSYDVRDDFMEPHKTMCLNKNLYHLHTFTYKNHRNVSPPKNNCDKNTTQSSRVIREMYISPFFSLCLFLSYVVDDDLW